MPLESVSVRGWSASPTTVRWGPEDTESEEEEDEEEEDDDDEFDEEFDDEFDDDEYEGEDEEEDGDFVVDDNDVKDVGDGFDDEPVAEVDETAGNGFVLILPVNRLGNVSDWTIANGSFTRNPPFENEADRNSFNQGETWRWWWFLHCNEREREREIQEEGKRGRFIKTDSTRDRDRSVDCILG